MTETPDTPFVTGETFEQLQAKEVWVTPTGGSRKTLADALADTAGGTVTKVIALDGPFLQGVTITTSGTILSSINPAAHGIVIGQGAAHVAATAAMSNGQLLVGQTGADPLPKTVSGDLTIDSAGAAALAVTGVAAGTYGDGTHVAQIDVDAAGRILTASSVTITGAAPSGSAGGDLSGTYPNPTVAKINGVPLGTVSATAGEVLVGNGSAVASSDTLTLGSGIKNALTVAPGAGSSSVAISFSQSGTGGYTFDGDVTVGHGVSQNNISLLHGAASGSQASINQTGSGALGFAGNVVVGVPTGGGKGAGALNAEALYVQGVAVGTGTGTVTSVISGAGLHAGTITTSGTLLADWNGGTVTTLGTGLSLTSGTLTATGSGSVTKISTSGLVTGGDITTAGTISLASQAATTLVGNGTTASAVPTAIPIGGGLTFNSGTLTSPSGTVTKVSTGALLTGGDITSAGTISVAAAAASTLIGNATTASAVPTAVPIGSGLAFSSGTLTATGSGGSVTSVVAAAPITGGTITTTGTIGLSIGDGLALNSGTLVALPSLADINAAGSNQATATTITADINIAGTVAASTGVRLLSSPSAGATQRIVNRGSNTVSVYPASGAAIESNSANAAVSVVAGGSALFIANSTTLWYVV